MSKINPPILNNISEPLKALNVLAAHLHLTLLASTKNKIFFNEQEYFENCGKLILYEGLRYNVEKALKKDEPFNNTLSLKELHELMDSKAAQDK